MRIERGKIYEVLITHLALEALRVIAILSIIPHLSTGLLPEPRKIEIYIYVYGYI